MNGRRPATPRLRRDVPGAVNRLTRALGAPLVGPEPLEDGSTHLTWRWACPACGAGEDDPFDRPLLVSSEGWFQCEANGCYPPMIASAIELRLLPAVAG